MRVDRTAKVPTKASAKTSPAPAPKATQLKQAVAGCNGFEAQSAALRPPAEGPDKGGRGNAQALAAMGTRGAGTTLPFAAQIQQSFGSHSLGDVRAHTGADAAKASSAMGAKAFACGKDVAFGDTPDLHTAAHEAAHVVQQRAGVHLSGGVGASGDRYEQHADRVADRVVRGESAEGLLDEFAGGTSSAKAVQRVDAPVSSSAVELTEDTELTEATEATEATSGADAGPVTLDAILGDGMQGEVDGVTNRLFDLSDSCRSFAQQNPSYARHPDGAYELAGALSNEAANLRDSASYDEAGELAYDTQLESRLFDGLDRARDAVRLLEALELLSNSNDILMLGQLFSNIGAKGVEHLEGLIFQAQTGKMLMENLVVQFSQHQGLFEKSIAASQKDVVSLFMGPIGTLGTIGKGMADWWRYYGMWEPVAKDMVSGSKDLSPLDLAKRVKTYGLAFARPVCESIGGLAKQALPAVGLLLNTAQTAIDIGLASGEVVVMKLLVEEARRVQTEYGKAMANYFGSEKEVEALLSIFTKLQNASVAASALIDAAEGTVASVDAKWGERLYAAP